MFGLILGSSGAQNGLISNLLYCCIVTFTTSSYAGVKIWKQLDDLISSVVLSEEERCKCTYNSCNDLSDYRSCCLACAPAITKR